MSREILTIPEAIGPRELNLLRGVGAEALCPTTGQICPRRAIIIAMHSSVSPSDNEMLQANGFDPSQDGIKLKYALAHHEKRALTNNCEGVPQESATCPLDRRIVADSPRFNLLRGLVHRVQSRVPLNGEGKA